MSAGPSGYGMSRASLGGASVKGSLFAEVIVDGRSLLSYVTGPSMGWASLNSR